MSWSLSAPCGAREAKAVIHQEGVVQVLASCSPARLLKDGELPPSSSFSNVGLVHELMTLSSARMDPAAIAMMNHYGKPRAFHGASPPLPQPFGLVHRAERCPHFLDEGLGLLPSG